LSFIFPTTVSCQQTALNR